MFALNWLTELGHDYMNQVQWGDDDIASVFNENYEYLKVAKIFSRESPRIPLCSFCPTMGIASTPFEEH